jgi:hypothetical protein
MEIEDNFTDCSKITLEEIKRDKDVKLKLRHKFWAKKLRQYL